MTLLKANQIDAPVGPNKDFVINGFMDVNQRGLSAGTGPVEYPADRMNVINNGMAGNFITEHKSFSPGHGLVTQNPEKYIRVSFNGTLGGVAASHYSILRYKFPAGMRFANGIFTAEFWATSQNAINVGIENRMIADSGDSADDLYDLDTQILPITAGLWKRYRFLVSLPTWTPPSLGGLSRYEVLFWLTMGTDRSAASAYVGPQASDFDIVNFGLFPGNLLHVPEDLKGMRDPELELHRSLPFYWRPSFRVGNPSLRGTSFASTGTNSNSRAVNVMFPRPMMRAPDASAGATIGTVTWPFVSESTAYAQIAVGDAISATALTTPEFDAEL
jgi:hypothetical protein